MTEIPEAPYHFIYEETTVEGKNVKVFKLGKFGKELVEKIPSLEARLAKLENNVYRLQKLERQQKILALLKAESKPRTYHWIQRRIPIDWLDIRELIDAGKLVESRHGKALMLEVPKE